MTAQVITVKLSRGENTSWGFRLQGGKDFSAPLSVQRVNPNSLADQAGLLPGDAILKIMGHNTDAMKHKEAQDTIVRAGNNLEMTVQRGGVRVWKPTITPIGDIPTVPQAQPHPQPQPVTKTSLAANKQEAPRIGSKHNVSARPFSAGNQPVMAVVHKQYNSPAGLYSMDNIAETLSAQTEVLASGAKGINFMKEDQPINKESAVYRMIHEEEVVTGGKGDDDSFTGLNPVFLQSHSFNRLQETLGSAETPVVTRHIEAPVTKPPSEKPEVQSNQNVCGECGKFIIGVFVRVKERSLHPECFRCSTCGTSLRNVGYFNVNEKLYCDIHAKQAASVMASTPLFEPVLMSQTHDSPTPPAPPPASTYTPTTPTSYGNISPVPFHPVKNGVKNGIIEDNTPSPTPPPESLILEPSHHSTTSAVPPPPPPPNVPSSGQIQSASTGLSPAVGSRPAPRRGRGQLKPQVGPGVRIPICSICGSPIRGPFVTALGKTWCPDHFLCGNIRCRRSLQDVGFVEEQGQLYCEICYETYLAPVCAKCMCRIKGDCLNALDKQWHPDCFVCAYCHKPFGNSSFYMEDGKPFCEKDWNELFTTKCVGCGYPIEAGDRWVEALNNNYHSQCFKCTICHKNLEGQSFYAKGGRPFCKAHAR